MRISRRTLVRLTAGHSFHLIGLGLALLVAAATGACVRHRPFPLDRSHTSDAALETLMPDAEAGSSTSVDGSRDATAPNDAVRDGASDKAETSPADVAVDAVVDLPSESWSDAHPDAAIDSPGGEPLLAIGANCTAGAQCLLGNCADGVCCDQACAGQCESCNQTGNIGTCHPVTGAPPAGRPRCAGTGACTGTCNGVNGAGCVFPATTTICGAARCNDGKVTDVSTCAGDGTCITPQPVACRTHLCADENRCADSCGDTLPCGAGLYCDATVGCLSVKDLSAGCSLNHECGSGFCVDGVCCSAACTGQCQACNEPTHVGQCMTVAGAPRGGRSACSGSGTGCGGQCDGNSASACAYPGGSTVCVPASCTGDQSAAVTASVCDGSGGCTSPQGQPCGAAAYCSNSACTARLASGMSCQSAIQCASGNCSNGLCCDSGQTNCNGSCVTLASDDTNCGTCGFACTTGQTRCNSGQCLLVDGQPCASGADCAGGSCGRYYRDADGDGYGAGSLTSVCGASVPLGYATRSGDCCDSNFGINPAAGPTDTMANCNGTLTWDWNCSGKVETSFPYIQCLPPCTSTSGDFPGPPPCGQVFTATQCQNTGLGCMPITIFVQVLKCG